MSAEEVFASTKDRPGSYDAIQTAKPNEPLFPIQGGDPFGPPTVLHWVSLCRRAGMEEEDPKRAEHLLQKATDAEQVAWQMQAYQRGQEPVEGERARYNDTGPLVAEANDARKMREARIRGAGRLHDSLARAQEVAEALATMHACPEAEVKIREAVQLLREAALVVEPRRGREQS